MAINSGMAQNDLRLDVWKYSGSNPIQIRIMENQVV